jgi:uncharacterized repeat protein (TIGR03803 family)
VGGTSDYGTVFKITPNGTLTTLYSFANSTDGGNPLGGLTEAPNGTFYGTTSYGGGNPCSCGTVFKITPAGKLTTLHTFVVGGSDGNYPQAQLVRGTDGNFYGTTAYGGANGVGVVFKITPDGALTTLHSFAGTDGGNPWGPLVQGKDGDFYGTTLYGGNQCSGDTCGTVFKISASGTLTTLHSFAGTDGNYPQAGLVQATDGNLYGTTVAGGASDDGTVFKISASGTLTTLHSFDGTDGGNPDGGLLQATDGTLYGTTNQGGASNDGTVFSVSVGLGPFVETSPTSGKVGTKVILMGTNLTGATEVTFNGTAAEFTVVSRSEIKTTVPQGATTGKVKVKTPRGTLTSNVVFRVTK